MEFRGISRVNKPLCGLFSRHYYTELPPKNQDMPGDSLPDFSRFHRVY